MLKIYRANVPNCPYVACKNQHPFVLFLLPHGVRVLLFFLFLRIMHTSFFSCQLCKRDTAKVSCLRIRSKFDLHLHQNKKRTLVSVGNFFSFKKQGTFYLGWSKIAKQVRRVRVENKSFK